MGVLLLPQQPVRLLPSSSGPQQWRVGGDAALCFFFPRLPSSRSPSPSPCLPSRLWNRGKGENPKWLVGSQQGARVWGVGTRSRRRKGKDAAAHGDLTRGRRGDVVARLWPAEPLLAWLRRAKGSFPLGDSPGKHALAAARRPGQPGGAAIPSGVRKRGRVCTRRCGNGKR
jgi:hypothetical protein